RSRRGARLPSLPRAPRTRLLPPRVATLAASGAASLRSRPLPAHADPPRASEAQPQRHAVHRVQELGVRVGVVDRGLALADRGVEAGAGREPQVVAAEIVAAAQ